MGLIEKFSGIFICNDGMGGSNINVEAIRTAFDIEEIPKSMQGELLYKIVIYLTKAVRASRTEEEISPEDLERQFLNGKRNKIPVVGR
jgi:hypothetical protein